MVCVRTRVCGVCVTCVHACGMHSHMVCMCKGVCMHASIRTYVVHICMYVCVHFCTCVYLCICKCMQRERERERERERKRERVRNSTMRLELMIVKYPRRYQHVQNVTGWPSCTPTSLNPDLIKSWRSNSISSALKESTQPLSQRVPPPTLPPL